MIMSQWVNVGNGWIHGNGSTQEGGGDCESCSFKYKVWRGQIESSHTHTHNDEREEKEGKKERMERKGRGRGDHEPGILLLLLLLSFLPSFPPPPPPTTGRHWQWTSSWWQIDDDDGVGQTTHSIAVSHPIAARLNVIPFWEENPLLIDEVTIYLSILSKGSSATVEIS